MLGLNQNKIYGRQCVIDEIDKKTAEKFINKNHLQEWIPYGNRASYIHGIFGIHVGAYQ